MTVHRLKIWPSYFAAVVADEKSFEVRKDDREPPYEAGDLVCLEEFNPDLSAVPPGYTGRWHGKKIAKVWRGAPMPEGLCAFSMINPDRVESTAIQLCHETTVSK